MQTNGGQEVYNDKKVNCVTQERRIDLSKRHSAFIIFRGRFPHFAFQKLVRLPPVKRKDSRFDSKGQAD